MASGAPVCVRKVRSTPVSPSFAKYLRRWQVFFPGWMLTQIGYVPNVAQADHTIEGVAPTDLHLPKRTGSSHHCGNGLLLI